MTSSATTEALPEAPHPRKHKKATPRRDALETRLMDVAGAAFERASWDACRRSGAWLGLLFYTALKHRREIAIANIRLAFPRMSEREARRIARRSCQNFAMTFGEFMHLKTASRESVRAYCGEQGLGNVFDGFAHGRGVILLTAHVGNWEVMGARAAQEFNLAVVARPSSNGGVQRHIEEVRRAAGIRIISKFDTGRASLQVLRDNEALGILPDQHAGRDGLLMPLFGHPTRFNAGLARLTMMSGATVVPAFGVRRTPWLRDGRILARIAPGRTFEKRPPDREAALLENTRWVAGELERIVRDHPDQWLWVHRRWRQEKAQMDEPAVHPANDQ